MAFEERFGIKIPDAEASELYTPRRVTDYILRKCGHRAFTRDRIAASVPEVIEKQTGIIDFSADSHFVYDMNLDWERWSFANHTV